MDLESFNDVDHLGAVNELFWYEVLLDNDFEVRSLPAGKIKKPDFEIIKPHGAYCEVTTLNVSREDKELFDENRGVKLDHSKTVKRLLRKITKEKKKQLEYKSSSNKPAILVLFDYSAWSGLGTQVCNHLSDHLLGDTMGFKEVPPTLSAIIYVERRVNNGMIEINKKQSAVYHNPFANNKLPINLFKMMRQFSLEINELPINESSLTKQIISLKKLMVNLSNYSVRKYTPWFAVFWGIVGSCYSLSKAELILDSSRDAELIQSQVKELIDIMANDNIFDLSEIKFESWFVGYYLNTAEQRMSSVLHRLLKTYHDENGKVDAYSLMRRIVDICQHCGGLPKRSRTRQLLNIFLNRFDDSVADDVKSMGNALKDVWKTVNHLKHTPSPSIDDKDPTERFKLDALALSALIQVFMDLSAHKGLQD